MQPLNMTFMKINIEAEPSVRESLIALLHAEGFESFVETERGIEAYIPEPQYNRTALEAALKRCGLTLQHAIAERIEETNWNKEWEKNFEPVFIDGQVAVRAPFHQREKSYPYEILVHPGMTFGTGHHETTRLMIRAQLGISHKNKKVLDIGTGTGILSILAAQMGASAIDVTDVDERSIRNARENFALNKVENYRIHQGVIEKLTFEYTFDILLANITKNILIRELPHYRMLMNRGATLVLSGFYEENVPELLREAVFHGLRAKGLLTLNQWACLILKRA